MSSVRDAYLETQVLTASPFKLRLMLIEGAIRFVNQSLHQGDHEQYEEALESSIRAREIVSELMSSLDPQKSPLAKQVLPLYAFIFRALTEGQLERNRQKVEDALRVLGEERETWLQVCDKFAGEVEQARAESPAEITAPTTLPAAEVPIAAPPLRFDSEAMGLPASRSLPLPPAASGGPPQSFSFEA